MRATYSSRPDEVEVFPLSGNRSDIIIRENVHKTEDEDGAPVWLCDETSYRVTELTTVEDVQAHFSQYLRDARKKQPDPLEIARAEKLRELSAACNAAIVSGIQVTLSDGAEHHFSLDVYDQLGIRTMDTTTPRHADGEPARLYPAADVFTIQYAADRHVLWHQVYYNALKGYVSSMTDINAVADIVYGVEIPEEYQTEGYQAFMRQ